MFDNHQKNMQELVGIVYEELAKQCEGRSIKKKHKKEGDYDFIIVIRKGEESRLATSCDNEMLERTALILAYVVDKIEDESMTLEVKMMMRLLGLMEKRGGKN